MTKFGEQLIASAEEAVAIAKGVQPAARIWLNGHEYAPVAELKRLQRALNTIHHMHIDISEGIARALDGEDIPEPPPAFGGYIRD